MRNMNLILFILLINCTVSAQNTDDIITLQSKAIEYYNKGEYSNAIILYEDLLAEQELEFGKENIRVAETLNRLGEMYSFVNMPDIANYYFNEAINIFQNSFQSRKNALELPLLSLLQIYSFQNDTLMMYNIEKQLQTISKKFHLSNSIYPEFPFDQDTLNSPEEDLSFDMMNLGLWYLDHGLYSEAAIQFNLALDNQTDNLDLDFFMDFFPNDSLLIQNMLNAFSFQLDYDTTGASYFYLALFNNSNEKAYEHIKNIFIINHQI